MPGRRDELRLRREHLLLRSELLRDSLALQSLRIAPPFGWVDQGVRGLRWLRANPEWPVGLVLVLVVARPRRVLRWSRRSLWAWALWRQWRPVVKPLWRAWNRAAAAGGAGAAPPAR
jgi:hypothetical protein